MDSFFFKLYQRLNSNKLLSLIFFVLLFAGLTWLTSRITFEEDITKLIPTNSETEEFQKVLKSVNFADKIIVNIRRQPGGSVEDLTQYANLFIESVQQNAEPYIKQIQGKVKDEDILGTLDFVYQNLPILLDETDYKSISEKIKVDSIATITEANYKTLISPSGIVAKKTILKDPLGISFIALKKLQQLAIGEEFTLKDGFVVSKDEQNLLLFITPKFASSETSENAVFSDSLYNIQDKLDNEFSGKVEGDYFGAALIAVANAKQIKNDIKFTTGITTVFLILMLIVFYKNVWVPLLLFVPTLFGGVLSIAILYLLRSEISAISLGIGSVLVGVTLDFSLHILTHIRKNENIRELYRDVTEPTIMCSLTAGTAFICLVFLDSQALQDLGIFAALNILGAAVFALIFIPLFYKSSTNKMAADTVLDRVAAYPFHKKKWLLISLSLLIFISAFTYKQVYFDNDISKLNYEPQEIIEAKNRLDALTDLSSKSMYLAAYGNSVESALQKNDLVFEKLQQLKENQILLDFSSIGALVNSEKLQKQKIENWNRFWSLPNIENTKANLIESGLQYGFKPSTFSEFYGLLEKDFNPIPIEAYAAISSFSTADFLGSEAGFTTVTSLVNVDNENAPKVRGAFKEIPNVLVIDRKELNEAFLGSLKDDFNNLIFLSLFGVLLVLYLFFRSVSLTLVTILPIFLSWFITIGIMGIFNIEFNIFNILVTTFIFGLGIDYSIFITKGSLQELRTGKAALQINKTAILLSSITTILGIGVMIFAKHPALFSIALISIIGILSAVLISFTVQPLLFKLFIGSKTKRPITPRVFLHSVISFGYFGLGGILLSLYSVSVMRIIPLSKKIKMSWFHKLISIFMKSVLYTNPFVKKTIINKGGEDFSKPAVIIANHTSFLDILAIGMLHPKICFLVNDWVYKSPVFGKAVQRADFYPVSSGIENSLEHLQKKVKQGYSLMAFPEGTRSTNNKVRRFHKGAFYLAGQFNLDILPVLIHGNSELNPKGSFVIQDGSLTLEILPRIKTDDQSFGENYTQRAKKIGAHFRNEFSKLREKMEGPKYFHRIVLEEFRYKGNALHRLVKKDLKERGDSYFKIISYLDKSGIVAHISENRGQLDFLLTLDGPDRKIYSFIENTEVKAILQNSYVTNYYEKLFFTDSLTETLKPNLDALILCSEKMASEVLEILQEQSVEIIVLFNEVGAGQVNKVISFGYQNVYEDANISIFKK